MQVQVQDGCRTGAGRVQGCRGSAGVQECKSAELQSFRVQSFRGSETYYELVEADCGYLMAMRSRSSVY